MDHSASSGGDRVFVYGYTTQKEHFATTASD